MDDFESKCVSVYKHLSRLPTISGVTVSSDKEDGDLLHWQLHCSERNLVRRKTVNYKTFGTVHCKDFKVQSFPFNSHTDEIASGYSSCGTMKAAVVQLGEKDDVKQYFEVWENNSKILTLDVEAEGKHGLVHSNPMFGCMEWSSDNTRVLYVADNKPFRKNAKQKASYLDGSDSVESSIKDKFLYEDSWGEQLFNCVEPTLCMLDLKKKELVNLFEYMPPDVSVSQAFWGVNNDSVVFTGFKSSPWKLGLIYCRNRPSGIYSLSLRKKALKTVVDCKDSIYSLTVTPNKEKVFYLQTKSLGPHSQCARLMSIGMGENSFGSPVTVCDYVKKSPGNTADFHGFFVRGSLPTECWLNNQQMIFESQNRSHVGLFVLEVESGIVKTLEAEGEWKVYAVKNNLIFASHSLPNVPQAFKIGKVKQQASELTIDWQTAGHYPEDLSDIKWKVLHHKPNTPNPTYPDVTFESVAVMPRDGDSLKGLVVNPHGGPHGCWSAGYDKDSACLARLGYMVLRVNYRGSTGFAQSGINSLIGNIGTQDVADTHQATEEAVSKFSIDPGCVFVKGGSHGGFLTLHLIAQYPDVYKAAVARNPVCNIVANTVASDIPDWSYSESGLPFALSLKPKAESYARMLEKSPVAIADKIKTPLMLMLGGSDRRVPLYQSIELYRIVKSSPRGNKVRMMVYEGNDHRIADIESATDSFVNSVLWFHSNYTKPHAV